MRKRRLAPCLLAAAWLLQGPAAEGASLTGTVVREEDGQPIQGARLWAAAGVVDAPAPPSAITGPDGSFAIPDLPAGAFALSVCARGYSSWAEIFGSAAAQAGPLRVALVPAAELRGRVLDAEGRPVTGISVIGVRKPDLSRSSPAWMNLHPCAAREQVDTDSLGRFSLGPLKPGRYELWAQTDRSYGEIHDVEAGSGSVIEGLEIRLHPAPPDEPALDEPPLPTGSPTPAVEPRAEEVLSPKDAPQDIRECRPPGPPEPSEPSTVFAIPTAAAEPVSPPSGMSESGTAWLRGRVLAPDGRPVAGATVRTRSAVRDPWALLSTYPWIKVPEATTDAEGRFSLGPLHPDWVRAVAHADPWTGRSEPVRVAEGETAEVEVRLQPRAALSGRVLDQAGQPVEGAQVSVAGERADSAADGSFRFIGLPPGPARVSVRDLPYEDLAREVEIGDGETRIDLVLAPDQRCGCVPVLARGRVTGPDGSPVAGAEISTLQGDEARSAADGSFEIRLPMLSPEEITVRKPRLAFGAALVAGAPSAGIEIRLEPDASITGRVLGLIEGEPAPDDLVWLRSRTGPLLSAPIRPDGTFEARQVASGTWELTTRVSEREATTTVILPPGRREVRADLVLPPAHRVSGRVVDELGRPLSGAELRAWRRYSMLMTAGTTRDDGSFLLLLSDGEYSVDLGKDGFQDGSIPALQVQGGPVAGLEVRLERAIVLRGHLLGLPMAERPRLKIKSVRSGHSRESNGWITLDRYSIPGLGPGLWTIEAESRHCTVQKTIEIPRGATEVELDLDLSPAEEAP